MFTLKKKQPKNLSLLNCHRIKTASIPQCALSVRVSDLGLPAKLLEMETSVMLIVHYFSAFFEVRYFNQVVLVSNPKLVVRKSKNNKWKDAQHSNEKSYDCFFKHGPSQINMRKP